MSNERQQRAARAEQMRKEREKADRKQRNLITVGIVVVVIALIAVAAFAINQASKDNEKVDDVITPTGATSDYGVVYDAEAAGGEAGEDPVEVVAYEDFQCPACLQFEQQSGAFLDDLVAKGEITVEYRPISFLDRASNGNRYSSRAASAALCVMDEGGPEAFKQMHQILFANQPAEGANGMSDADLITFAGQAGAEGIDSCIKQERFVPWVEEATSASRDADVSATPTVLVDGKPVESPSPQGLQQAIDAAKKG